MKYRILTKSLKKAVKTFPAVVVTGPRQSGKTTLLKNLFQKTHSYVNLENPDVRLRVNDDPVSFLQQLQLPVIIDEIQYSPHLLPYIKEAIDNNRRPGQWLLTGSQNFTLMQGISESLAGRAAVLSLLPFNYIESLNQGERAKEIEHIISVKTGKPKLGKYKDIAQVILRGSYPEMVSNPKIDRQLWCGSYITTYLERDIRNLSQVGDLGQFERFLRLCAIRTGQILNISELAREIGIAVPTAKRWLSLLETGYQIFLLYPYYRNLGKRIVKSPKLYFNDTALASYLLGLHEPNTLLQSPHFAHLFETFIITDFWKRFLHFAQMPSLYYFKTRDGLEVDLVIEISQKLYLLEIKATASIVKKHAQQLMRAKKDFGAQVASASLVSQTRSVDLVTAGIKHYHWQELLQI